MIGSDATGDDNIRRCLPMVALGIAFAGIPLGGAGITIVASRIVQHGDFRAGYIAMGLPIRRDSAPRDLHALAARGLRVGLGVKPSLSSFVLRTTRLSRRGDF
jgi:hypothetical protein